MRHNPRHTNPFNRLYFPIALIILLFVLNNVHEGFVYGQQHNPNQGGGQQQQQTNQTTSNSNNTSKTNGSNNSTELGTGNSTLSTNGGNNQTNITSNIPSSTPITFPLAPLPSSGALAGTFQAPFPAQGPGNGQALGPDDNYIASAVKLLPNYLISMKCFVTVALIVFVGAIVL